MRGNICGERIRARRIELNMAQVKLAAALEVDYGLVFAQSDISEIERNVRGVKDYELKAISEILGVTTAALLDDLPKRD